MSSTRLWRLTIKSSKLSKARDLGLVLPDRSDIWEATLQHRRRGAPQKSERYDHNPISWLRGFTRFVSESSSRDGRTEAVGTTKLSSTPKTSVKWMYLLTPFEQHYMNIYRIASTAYGINKGVKF